MLTCNLCKKTITNNDKLSDYLHLSCHHECERRMRYGLCAYCGHNLPPDVIYGVFAHEKCALEQNPHGYNSK